ncbi:7TM domain-containing protein [Patescibacteria group bacterium]
MKNPNKYIIPILLSALILFGVGLQGVGAQELEAEQQLEIVNLSGTDALINEAVSFTVPSADDEDQVIWNFGDDTVVTGKTVEKTYSETGVYDISVSVIASDGTLEVGTLAVSVFSEYIVALIDRSVMAEEIKTLATTAAEHNIYLKTLRADELQTLYQRERSLTDLLVNTAPVLSQAKLLIDWTQGTVGLASLLAAQQAPNAVPLDLSNQIIISVTKTISFDKRIAQLTYDVINPVGLVLTEKETLPVLVASESLRDVTENLQQTGTNFEIIQQTSPPLSERVSIVNFFFPGVEFVAKRGLPLNTLVIFLALPLIALFFIIGKQVIGLRTFGLYIPVLLTVALLPLGLVTGLVVFLGSLFITELIRPSFRWMRLSFLPRSAIMVTAITLLFLGFFVVAGTLDYIHLLPYAIFPALLSIPLIEKFASVRIEKSRSAAIRYTLETMLMVVISFVVINLPVINTLIISYPETIIIVALLAFLVGRFTGLRIVEYYRFQDLIRALRRD